MSESEGARTEPGSAATESGSAKTESGSTTSETDAGETGTGSTTSETDAGETGTGSTTSATGSPASSPTANGAAADVEPDPTTDPEPATPPADRPATGAEAVVRALEDAGVATAFGVQGGAIMPVYDALYDSSVRHVTMAHEQGAAHAADAYNIVSDRPGVCMATSGPGATNLVTGLADADMDSEAVVALTGQVPASMVGSDAFQETDTVGVTTPVTKHNYFAGDADSVGATVSEAVALSQSGRPGPTLVDLPKDVTQDETDRPAPTSDESPEDAPERADPSAVERAARAIEEAERPLCLFGGGVLKGNATDEARAFAREHDLPVTTTMPALGVYPENDERCLSFAGMHGTGAANMAVTHTDCLVAVGTRFDDRLTGSIETFAPEAEVVHVDIDPAEISKNIHADYPLVGDAATVLEQLGEAMTRSPDADEWREQCTTWQAEYPLTYAAPADEPLKPQFVVEAFDEATPEDTVVTTGVGQHQMWACQFWTFRQPRTWVSSHGLGAMGYGLPAAIGARLALDEDGKEETPVVCFDGDGSFLMTMQELAVAVREELDVTVAVLNNEYIGMVRQWQDAFYEGRRMASEYNWCPDFAALAEGFGAKGIAVDDYDEVADAVQDALAYDGPAVVDFHVDPAENVLPMVPSGGDNGRFALEEGHL